MAGCQLTAVSLKLGALVISWVINWDSDHCDQWLWWEGATAEGGASVDVASLFRLGSCLTGHSQHVTKIVVVAVVVIVYDY